MTSAETRLPIAEIRESLCAHMGRQPVVLSSPTGSGKSTQVPRYAQGRVLVVEPRRVACRALAARVAQLEGCTLGTEVGYQVRDDVCCSENTRILFVTPGIALRIFDSFDTYSVVILDEFHERGLETDLLYALVKQRYASKMVVMSATLQAERIAQDMSGLHLTAAGRLYPVDIQYHSGGVLLPTTDGLEQRVVRAVDRAAAFPGDTLVFLPGKAEIAAVRGALSHGRADLEIVELHGGLSLKDQSRIFARGRGQRVILATNVAETSLTVPGIDVVIDSGLVRRTRYHQGRGYLSLMPVAMDSAAQRAGRAGRLGPGTCIRLWSESAKLEDVTVPEIHRESLTPMLLAAAAIGHRMCDLRFLDAPKPHALQDARDELLALGALDEADVMTEAGRALFGLPLDPALGRLLIEAKGTDGLQDVVDLCAGLSVTRPIFLRPVQAEDPDSLREAGCDATAVIGAVRRGDPALHPVSAAALREARSHRDRLRAVLGMVGRPAGQPVVDRLRLARLAVSADPRMAYVSRARKARVVFSNGGTEVELARDSCVRLDRPPDAVVAFGARGVADKGRTRMILTCACPVPLSVLEQAGLGRDRVAGASAKGGRVVSVVERVYAKRVLSTREETPVGTVARQTLVKLLCERRVNRQWSAALDRLKARLAHLRLARLLAGRRPRPEADWASLPEDPGPLDSFIEGRLLELGVEAGQDVWLLDPDDLQPEALPYDVEQLLLDRYPLEVSVGDAHYRAEFELDKGRVVLNLVRGAPSHPPKRQFLPAFTGLQVFAEARGRLHRVT